MRVKRSLQYIAEHGAQANSETIAAASSIFQRTADEQTRRLCLDSFSRVDSPKARQELLRISQDQTLDPAGKTMVGEYLETLSARRKSETPLSASRDKAGDQTGQQ